MPKEKHDDFNRSAGNIFAREYERETGRQVTFKGVGKELRLQEFPDVVLEWVVDNKQKKIDVEFAIITLGFISEERPYFEQDYQKQFDHILEAYRPQYKNMGITLQRSLHCVEAPRPIRLPKVRSLEGKGLIADFKAFLSQHSSALVPTPQGILLEKQAFPELTKSFEAVLLNPIRDDDPRKRHPDDPIITLSVMYQSVEIEKAIQNALKSKLDKGRAYTADILALHTLRLSSLRDDAPPDLTIPIVHEDEIEEVVSIFLHEHKVLREMFKEFWFLDAYMKEGKQLYRLTV